mmetsp:Transcript_32126/g.73500  ORF Transcript_32126/g.73500 Transcript_32126/m.73500 type:complete len:986 (-) Transcript_32126:12-2969(-)
MDAAAGAAAAAAAGVFSHGAYAAGAGVAAGGGATAVFGYNRENFLYDRTMRRKKEIAEMQFRIAQASLWREDVRDIVGLVERKMSAYLFVSVLILSFVVALWVEGKLPEGSPHWLMLGNQVSICGAFMFLLLAVWLATYTAVAAKSYETRILTQMVRLPVPSWDEVEATRTYGSSFERLQATQMLRVPFVMGQQKSRVPASTQAAEDHESPAGPHGELTDEAASATDPWGLERSAGGVYELGAGFEEDVAKLRHVKLVRQAAVYYETYDAFARLSLSIGVNQLILAMQYFILGYVLLQVHCPYAAGCGVAALTILAESISILDMELTRWQRFLVRMLIDAAAVVQFLSVLSWAQENTFENHKNRHAGRSAGDYMIPIAFVAHGLFLYLMTAYCDISQVAGAMMPTTFRYVLFLDVFGWFAKKKESSDIAQPEGTEKPQITLEDEQEAGSQDAESTEPTSASLATSSRGRGMERQVSNPTKSRSLTPPSRLGIYAMDYVGSGAHSDGSEPDLAGPSVGELCTATGQRPSTLRRKRTKRPGLRSVQYQGRKTQPSRPEDFAPAGAVDDMRHWVGAPNVDEQLYADAEPSKEFFKPSSFIVNGTIEDTSSDCIVSGHDHEAGGTAPFLIFQRASNLLLFVWLVAALLTTLETFRIVETAVPWAWENESFWAKHPLGVMQGLPAEVERRLRAAGFDLPSDWTDALVAVTWPVPEFVAKDLACDVTGEHFVATDGVSMYSANLLASRPFTSQEIKNERAKHFLRGGSMLSVDAPAERHELHFSEINMTDSCNAALIQGLADVAVVCSAGDSAGLSTGTSCEAVVLNQDGQKLALCELGGAGSVEAESGFKRLPTSLQENLVSISLDPRCASRGLEEALESECIVGQTAVGHILHMRSDEVLTLEAVSAAPGEAARALGADYLAVLHADSNVITVSNNSAGGGTVAQWPTPPSPSGFCVGGGWLNLLAGSPQPSLWRVPLPPGLNSLPPAA